MYLLKELSFIFELHLPEPKVHCKVFEDNRSCISIACGQKFPPRTKHIAIKYHHFREFVRRKIIQVLPINTKEQRVDVFSKPLKEDLFVDLRKKLNGWRKGFSVTREC